jgi:ATP/maltotriose-dependent transcriptional regulator MalT
MTRSQLLMHLATIAWLQGDFATAEQWNEESLALGNEHRDVRTTAYALGLAGRLAVVRGDFVAGRSAFQQSLDLIHAVGDFWWEGRVREGLATVALQYGDFSAAATQLEHAIKLARTTRDDWSLATLLTGLGDVSRARGNYPRAGDLYAESEALHRRLGTEPAPTLRHNQAYVALHAGNLREAHRLFTESLRLFQGYSEQRGMAECLVGLAGVAASVGDRSRAALLLGAAEAGFDTVRAQISPSNRGDFSRVTALARASWTAEEFKAAWTSGYELGLAAAAAGALASPEPGVGEATFKAGPLSHREAQVAALIARGQTSRQIATSLIISEATVERHTANIFRKLGFRSRAQVATWATHQGLLPST